VLDLYDDMAAPRICSLCGTALALCYLKAGRARWRLCLCIRRPHRERPAMPIGKCPDFGRTVRLGKLVRARYVVGPDGFLRKKTVAADKQRTCMDCRVGPPKHLWKTCPECGEQTPTLSSCEVCRAAGHVHSEVAPSPMRRRTLTFYDGIQLWLQPDAQESSREYPMSRALLAQDELTVDAEQRRGLAGSANVSDLGEYRRPRQDLAM